MTRILPIAALLLVSACGQQEQAPAAANEANSATASADTPVAVPALAGAWSVAAIDGRPVGADSAMIANFDGGKVSISSGCLRRAWTYTQKRNVVAFSVNPGGSANCGGGTPSGDQEAVYAVLTQANIVIFGKGGSEASLSGTGGGLTLKRR
jgi:hypothetical protein